VFGSHHKGVSCSCINGKRAQPDGVTFFDAENGINDELLQRASATFVVSPLKFDGSDGGFDFFYFSS
jgi:hypothetical protein